ncbi:MAG: cytochrome c maturation protein CcmE domain-containing protein [Coriobacteriia bacterium]
MRRHLAVAAVLVTAVAIGAWLTTHAANECRYMSVTEVVQSHPSGDIHIGGRVLSSSKQGQSLRLVVGDENGSTDPTLLLEYSGTQSVSFGPGVTVLARGSLKDDGVFDVTDFVTKAPQLLRGSPRANKRFEQSARRCRVNESA